MMQNKKHQKKNFLFNSFHKEKEVVDAPKCMSFCIIPVHGRGASQYSCVRVYRRQRSACGGVCKDQYTAVQLYDIHVYVCMYVV